VREELAKTVAEVGGLPAAILLQRFSLCQARKISPSVREIFVQLPDLGGFRIVEVTAMKN
jgi:hypothetical protein